MAILPIEELEKKVGSRYALTVLAGKRARELRDGAPQLVNTDSSNPILIALQEIYEGKIVPDNLDYSAEEPAPVVAEGEEASPLAGMDIAELTGAEAAGVELPGSVDITGAPTDASAVEVAAETEDRSLEAGESEAAASDVVAGEADEAVDTAVETAEAVEES